MSLSPGQDADDVEKEAMFLLASVDDAKELEDLCTSLEVTVPEQLRGKSKSLRKFLLRHLNSETVETSDDGGMALFLKSHECLTTSGDKTVQTSNLKIEENSETKVNSELPVAAKSRRPLFDALKLKDFKISGTIGGNEKKTVCHIPV